MADNFTEMRIDINSLKKDMESVRNHELKFNRTIERVENSIDTIEKSVIKIDIALEHFKDIPLKIRSLEDKSIVYDMFKLALGIVLGVIITNYVEDKFMATRDKNEYKIEKSK